MNKLHRCLVPVLLAALVSGCNNSGDNGGSSSVDQDPYRAAVADAAVATEGERCDKLVPVVETNRALLWRTNGGESEVLMATWTSWTGYLSSVGQPTALSREVWVTPAPLAQAFCQGSHLAGDDLVLRLEQLLGLPAGNGKTLFVEFWVRPADLFRPSPDPEITDTVAELDYSPGVDPAHRQWVENLKATSYGDGGYPWTRLGYTYDWGSPVSEVGLSEFVIRKGATATVEAAVDTFHYCGKAEVAGRFLGEPLEIAPPPAPSEAN